MLLVARDEQDIGSFHDEIGAGPVELRTMRVVRNTMSLQSLFSEVEFAIV